MTDTMSAPLTPADCDLQDFRRIQIDIPRLRGSDFDATLDDGAWRAGVNLWLSSWHQVPAASLEDNEATLAKLAGLGRDVRTWRKVKAEALRGWVKCEDGLLYHPVVAEIALEAWLEKLLKRLAGGAGNASRWGAAFDAAEIERKIEQSAELLAALNPDSKALAKLKRRGTRGRPDADETQSQADRTANRSATKNRSHCDADIVAQGSQETGTGKGIGGSSDELPLGAGDPAKSKAGRRKPEVTIPDGFPDQRALLEAQTKLRAEGVDLDARAQAERFRNHAQQTDRRCRDWAAAWRNWVAGAIDRAPKKGPAATVETMDQAAVWRARLGKFVESRFWREQWGAQPARSGPQPPGVQVPNEILAEFGFPQARSAA